jgi:hypothetical protein
VSKTLKGEIMKKSLVFTALVGMFYVIPSFALIGSTQSANAPGQVQNPQRITKTENVSSEQLTNPHMGKIGKAEMEKQAYRHGGAQHKYGVSHRHVSHHPMHKYHHGRYAGHAGVGHHESKKYEQEKQ